MRDWKSLFFSNVEELSSIVRDVAATEIIAARQRYKPNWLNAANESVRTMIGVICSIAVSSIALGSVAGNEKLVLFDWSYWITAAE